MDSSADVQTGGADMSNELIICMCACLLCWALGRLAYAYNNYQEEKYWAKDETEEVEQDEADWWKEKE